MAFPWTNGTQVLAWKILALLSRPLRDCHRCFKTFYCSNIIKIVQFQFAIYFSTPLPISSVSQYDCGNHFPYIHILATLPRKKNSNNQKRRHKKDNTHTQKRTNINTHPSICDINDINKQKTPIDSMPCLIHEWSTTEVKLGSIENELETYQLWALMHFHQDFVVVMVWPNFHILWA